MSRPRPFVLASASPARLALLRDAGIDARVVVSGVDEEAVSASDPAALALRLAELKAQAVAASEAVHGALVLGCDSVLDLDGQPLGKPTTRAEVRERWRAMRGRSGVLVTGHCLVDTVSGRTVSEVASTTVRFGTPDDAEIDAYAGTAEPYRVAGSFTLLGLAGPFVDGVDGDPGNVLGLSLPLLRRMLAGFGVGFPALWSPELVRRAPVRADDAVAAPGG